MKKIILCSSLCLLSICVCLSCGSDDDSSSESTTPWNKKTTSGKFQINAEGTKVCFAPGNLQATYDGSTWSWAFAANQWDYIGYSSGNISITDRGELTGVGTVDLFGWVGETSMWSGTSLYGINKSIEVNSKYTYGNIASEALKSDWGNTISDGYTWRTLSFSEWTYVFNTRTSGSTVNGTYNARYTFATINSDDIAVQGIILFPDGITIEADDVTSWGTINYVSVNTVCTSAQWKKLATKGCAFLPAAGYRHENMVRDAGYGCYYWSSSSHTTDVSSAYAFISNTYDFNTAKGNGRPKGCSVRLVREVE